MKTDTDTKDLDRFNPQQNTDNNRTIQYEKRNGETFIRSYRMNLLRTVGFIASINWYGVPLPNGDQTGSNDYNERSPEYCLKGWDCLSSSQIAQTTDTFAYEGEK